MPPDADSSGTSRRPGGRATAGERLAAGFVALLCAALLGVSAGLTPSPSGYGTHRALNLPACDWVVGFSMPCPTCGMTTAFSWATAGDLASSARAQPFGALLAVATAAAFWIGLHVAVTGSGAFRIVGRTVLRPPLVWGGGVAFLLAWGYKVLTWPG